MEDERMEVDSSDDEKYVAGPSSSRVDVNVPDRTQQQQQQRRQQQQPVACSSRAASDDAGADYDDSEWDEVVEESLIHVTLDNADDISNVNATSNVRVIAIDTDSPALQVENKIFHLNEWKYIPGTAMFFEKTNEVKSIDLLYDNRCGSVFQHVGSTRKCLEMTKKDNTL